MSSRLEQTQSPLLKTFWQRFWAAIRWGTHLNLPRTRFKRCVGSNQAVLRENPAHKSEDNIRQSQTTQSKFIVIIIISHGEGLCSEPEFGRQVGDSIYFHRYPESDNLVIRQS